MTAVESWWNNKADAVTLRLTPELLQEQMEAVYRACARGPQPYYEIVSPEEYEDRVASGLSGPGGAMHVIGESRREVSDHALDAMRYVTMLAPPKRRWWQRLLRRFR